MTLCVIHGDCLAELPKLAASGGERFHAAVTDPPYHLTSIVKRFGSADAAPAQYGTDGAFARASRGFMGKQWDGGDIAFRPETWRAVYDVLRPGAFLVAFGGTRTFHRMACAIEDAGFIIHPFIAWVFASGFPKATRLKCDDAEGFRYGTQALKPAIEPICVAQRPMEGTGTENWIKHGCGALNIDGCRVPAPDGVPKFIRRGGLAANVYGDGLQLSNRTGDIDTTTGRWPANLLHDGSPEVLDAFAAYGDAPGQQRYVGPEHGQRDSVHCYGDYGERPPTPPRNDTGTAARFFYTAKADKADRADSKHPTVKPVDLMRWLVRLVCPPGGHVIDPFAGSGTTGEAAMLEGFNATLIERDEQHYRDILHRKDRWSGNDLPLFTPPDVV